MRLTISHSTTYHYDTPVPYALQQLRKWPRSGATQEVTHWQVEIEGGTSQVIFEDQYANLVELVRLDPDITETTVVARGEVTTTDTAGVISRNDCHAPLWLFRRTTPQTAAGPRIRELVASVAGENEIGRLHQLAETVREAVDYEKGRSDATSTAEEVVDAGHGVCQDHAHVFVAGARLLGHPARYVSGYLHLDDAPDQDASHAWGEAWVDGLGWVGFDVSNGISPDERYVRLATGLDYPDAAPISGVRYGDGEERLDVSVQVQQ